MVAGEDGALNSAVKIGYESIHHKWKRKKIDVRKIKLSLMN